jgi:hypothetical protein
MALVRWPIAALIRPEPGEADDTREPGEPQHGGIADDQREKAHHYYDQIEQSPEGEDETQPAPPWRGSAGLFRHGPEPGQILGEEDEAEHQLGQDKRAAKARFQLRLGLQDADQSGKHDQPDKQDICGRQAFAWPGARLQLSV